MIPQQQPPPQPPQPEAPLQIPPGYMILPLAGREYVIPRFLIRSTLHAVGAVVSSERVGIYQDPSYVSQFKF